jgi:hypothetical protein
MHFLTNLPPLIMLLNYSYNHYILKILFGFMLLIALYFIYKAALVLLSFDDAYMFTRYAKNILINHTFGWNAGERTYGCTSIAYVFFITLAELLFPKAFASDEIILKFSSFFWGILALVFIYKSLRIAINNSVLKKIYFSELIILIIVFMPVFVYNLFNGMDAAMSLFGNSLMIFLFLQYYKKQSLLFLLLAALSAYFIFFIRPDNGICMLVFPALFLWSTTKKPKPFIITYTVIIVCLVIDIVAKYLYFGYIVPLPFYIKSVGLYNGYLGIAKWNATQYLYDIFIPFFTLIIIFILVIKKTAAKKTFFYWLPFLLTCGYFYTVIQVMGMASRYYLPFIPFFIIGLATGINNSLPKNINPDSLKVTWLRKRILILLLLIPFTEIFSYLSGAYYARLYTNAEKVAKKFSLNNSIEINSLQKIEWWHAILIFDSLLKRLPDTTIVAASEDGFIGSDNMNMHIEDLSQLHNNDILKKHSLEYSIEKNKPDVIWLPHSDYTKMRYEIYHSKQLMCEYDFYPEVLNYGIAIKKTYTKYNSVISYFENLYKVNSLQKINTCLQ